MRVLAVGDSYMPRGVFRKAFRDLEPSHRIDYVDLDGAPAFTPVTESELRLREYFGSPDQVVRCMDGVEVLAVHGAPVTDEVLDASEVLRLVCCARGGPLNVDLEAVRKRGVPLINTPGKNAEAVADLTIAFLVMLARGIPKAMRFLDDGGEVGGNWQGSQFMGNDLRGHTLGLIGYGQVGQRVAIRATAFGMHPLVYDPYVEVTEVDQVNDLKELLGVSGFVSVHARATADNWHLIDERALSVMRQGAFLVNTARATLVDQGALDTALASGHLGGAALDVFAHGPPGERSPLLRHPNVVLTPHMGGATSETLMQGALMIAQEIEHFAADEPLSHVVNMPVP